MIDLFELEQRPKRHFDKSEAAALVEVLRSLKTHPVVACTACCANSNKVTDEKFP